MRGPSASPIWKADGECYWAMAAPLVLCEPVGLLPSSLDILPHDMERHSMVCGIPG